MRQAGWALTLLLGIAVGWWAAPRGSEPPVARVESVAAPPAAGAPVAGFVAASPPPAVTSSTSSSPAAPTPEAPSPEAPTLGYDGPQFLQRLPGLLKDVAERAQQGGPRALAELAEWMEYCEATATFGFASTNPDYLGRGDQRDASIRSHLQQVAALCRQWIDADPWLKSQSAQVRDERRRHFEAVRQRKATMSQSPQTLAQRLLARAAEAGDLATIARTSREGLLGGCGSLPTNYDGERLQTLQQCQHERRRELLGTILQQRDPSQIAAVPRILGGHGGNRSPFFPRSYFQIDTDVLWQLAACEFGLDCSASGPLMRNTCLREGLCRYRHYRDYVRDRVLPPSSMRDIERLLPPLVDLVLARDVDAILGPPPRF